MNEHDENNPYRPAPITPPITPPVQPNPYTPGWVGSDTARSNEVFPGPTGGPPRPGGKGALNPSPRRWRLIAIVGIVLAFMAGCTVGVAAGQEGDPTTAQQGQEGASAPLAESPATDAAPTAKPPAEKPAQSVPAAAPTKPPAPKPSDPEPVKMGNGVHQVGVDIAPGRYKTRGPDQDSIIPMCTWTRLKDDSGEFDAIIAIDNGEGPMSVTVKSSDKFVEFSGDCTWVKQ